MLVIICIIQASASTKKLFCVCVCVSSFLLLIAPVFAFIAVPL